MENMTHEIVTTTVNEVAKQGVIDSVKSVIVNNPITSTIVGGIAVAGIGYGLYRMFRKTPATPAPALKVESEMVPDAKVTIETN